MAEPSAEDLARKIHDLQTQVNGTVRPTRLEFSSVVGASGVETDLLAAADVAYDASNAIPGLDDTLAAAAEAVAAAQADVDAAVAAAQEAWDAGVAAGELAGAAADDALDKAETARQNAQVALNNAQTAQAAADDAKAAGDQAKVDAAAASTAAADAGSRAQTAYDNAVAAASAASTAQSVANSKGDVWINSTAPAAALQKSTTIWIDTTNGANTPKRWNGSAWVATTDKVATDAATAAGNAQTTANGAVTTANSKADVLIQSTTPAASYQKATTLWIDTTSGANTPKRWSGSAWVATTDKAATDAAAAASTAQSRADSAFTAAGTAQTAANTAQSTADTAKTNAATAQSKADQASTDAATAAGIANGKADTLIQSTAPAAAYQKSTTLWIDTTSGANTPKRWSGSAWVAVTDKAATDAAAAAATAKTAADNAKTAADNAQSTANAANTAASNAQDTATAANLAAGNAQTTANGKNKSTYSASAPSNTSNPGTAAGDIWFQRNTSGNLVAVFEWTGSAWTSRPIDNALIATLDAGKINTGFLAAGRIAAGTITGDHIAARTITAADIATNAITANEIAANTITASLIAANTITAAQIAANTITATQIAANTITASEIKVGAITGDRIAAGTLTAGLIAAGAIGTGQLAANAVTAAKIAGGTITGDLIAANTITAKSLTLGDFTNMVDDPDFSASFAAGPWNGTASIVNLASGQGPNGYVGGALQVVANGSSTFDITQAAIPVTAGEQWYAEVWVRETVNATAGTIQLAASLTGSATSYPNFASISAATQGSTWTKYTGNITIPTSATKMSFRLSVRNDVTSGATVQFARPRLRRMNGSELIVDGSIDTAALAAGAVTAAKITAGTITGDRIAASTLTGDRIAANTLTAANIAAATLTSATIAANAITAREIAADGVTAANIAANAILARNIKASEITATHIAAATITGAKIASNTVTANNIAANTITANEIAAGAITATLLSADAINGKTITGATIKTATSGRRLEIIGQRLDVYGPSATSAVRIQGVDNDTNPGNSGLAMGLPDTSGNITNGFAVGAKQTIGANTSAGYPAVNYYTFTNGGMRTIGGLVVDGISMSYTAPGFGFPNYAIPFATTASDGSIKVDTASGTVNTGTLKFPDGSTQSTAYIAPANTTWATPSISASGYQANTLRYRRQGNTMQWVGQLNTTGTVQSNTTIGTLPAGFAPDLPGGDSRLVVLATATAGTLVRLMFYPDGRWGILDVSGGTTSYVIFGGISYPYAT